MGKFFYDCDLITPKCVDKYNYINFNRLSKSKIINFDFIEKHIDKKWNYDTLYSHPDLTLIFIFNHFDNMWNFNVLSETNILSFDFIKAYSEYSFILVYLYIQYFI